MLVALVLLSKDDWVAYIQGAQRMETFLSCLSEIAAFLGGSLVGSLVTFRYVSSRASGRATVVNQSKSQAGRDIVGRDKISK